MLLIKGCAIEMKLSDGKWITPPKANGFVHDPDGELLDRCYVYIGPYRKTKTAIEGDSKASWYFGSQTALVAAKVDVPHGQWEPVGRVEEILYRRVGKHKGDFVHTFAPKAKPSLARSGKWLRLSLPKDCVLDWRGFVYP